MRNLAFDKTGFRIDGRDAYLVSGEFHYFRVPRADWRNRMQLFLDAGGNCLATYVPWLIHEPAEGDIRFGGEDSRDLRGFLMLAQEMGLKVLLRPGPYQYSELVNDGLPEWLIENYPEILARDIDGKPFRHSSVSYLHPTFLSKARIYYRAFAEQVRPFMAANGGPVSMLQVDNELGGIHVWFGSMDYHAETMGFGREDGRYAEWLRARYGRIDRLNAAYNTAFETFAQVLPPARAVRKNIASCRRVRDYEDFYRSTLAEYASLLAKWLREDGLSGPICHNSANPGMNALFTETVKAMGEDFLLGSDHYYNLDQNWAQNSPTPQYALRILESCDTLRAMGMPPTVMELPGGSPSDTPPILPEDLLACYMTNAALGAKGVNYYVYTGGPNFPDTGTTCDIYDYNALVHADGRPNETYASLKTFGDFMRSHGWMQRAHRAASVQVGFEWELLRSEAWDPDGQAFTGAQAQRFMERGVLYTLMCSKYAPELVSLEAAPDINRPLIIPCASTMSVRAQQTVIDFAERGGSVLLMPVLPETDWNGEPAALLKAALGDPEIEYGAQIGPAVRVEGVGRVFRIENPAVCTVLPKNACAIAADDRSGRIMGFERPLGKGKVFWFGGAWAMSTFPQAEMMERFAERMGAKPCVSSSNRHLFTSLWEGVEGQRTLFIMNLYSGAQSTQIEVRGEVLGEFRLAPMEVRTIDLHGYGKSGR